MDNEKMTENISNEVSKTEPTDIFQWANLTDGIKNELDVEFLIKILCPLRRVLQVN